MAVYVCTRGCMQSACIIKNVLLDGIDRSARSLLNLAKENKLTESFLWIPSLEGPTFDAPPTEMMNWIKEWTGKGERAAAMLWLVCSV